MNCNPAMVQLRRLFLLVFFAASLLAQPATAQPPPALGPALQYAEGAADGAAQWADVDGDGDQDLLISGRGSDEQMTSLLYRNSGSGLETTPISSGLPEMEFSSLSLADYDRDGDLDALVTGQRGVDSQGRPVAHTGVYRNNGQGVFNLVDTALQPVYRGSAEWGDADNDGDLDIVLAGYLPGGEGFGAFYKNSGGAFTGANAPVPQVGDSTVAWGDFDADDDLDVLVMGKSRQSGSDVTLTTQVLSNDAGVFSIFATALPGMWYGDADWADVNMDGYLDLLLTGNTGTGTSGTDRAPATYLYRYNNQQRALVETANPLPALWQSTLAWGDYDNDGDPDLLLNGLTPTAIHTAIYTNNAGTLTLSPENLRSYTGASVAWGHADGDGSLDLVVSGVETEPMVMRAFVYRSAPPAANAAPHAAPAPVSACWNEGERVYLDWSDAADDHTPASGLTYALRVGTAPGLSDIIAPTASVSGKPLIPATGAQGNESNAYLARVNNDTPGTYYWSVQALDASYTGGAFGPEGMFAYRVPVAKNDSFATGRNTAVDLTVLNNDEQSYGALRIHSVDVPRNGTAEIVGNQIRYTPKQDFSGTDTFSYYAATAQGPCSRASVTVAVAGFIMETGPIPENFGSESIVGRFSVTGASDEAFTYALVPGAVDNNIFYIPSPGPSTGPVQLRVAPIQYPDPDAPLDYDDPARPNHIYTVRATASGSRGTQFTGTFTISVTNVDDEGPTDLIVSNDRVKENAGPVQIATLSTLDPDGPDTVFPHTYTLMNPTVGDSIYFEIKNGNQLWSKTSFDYERASHDPFYHITIRTTDTAASYRQETFPIYINNIADSPPTSLDIRNKTVSRFAPLYTPIGNFVATDPDIPIPGDTHSFQLISGPNCPDSNKFMLYGNTLLVNTDTLAQETKTDLLICVQVKDSYNLIYPANGLGQQFAIRLLGTPQEYYFYYFLPQLNR